jgi:amino acid adenylation domain-containing protein
MNDNGPAAAVRLGDEVPVEWMLNPGPLDDVSTLVSLVETSAVAAPEWIALRCSDGSVLTYGELWQKAGNVASWLAGRGIGAGARVGILAERSPWVVVGIVGVLRSGAAYVPFGPRWPADRIGRPLDRLGIPCLLTTRRLAGLAEEASWHARRRPTIVCLDSDEAPVDPLDKVGTAQVWDDIAAEADPVRASGLNVAAGDDLGTDEVTTYLAHVAALVARVPGPVRLLDIGCGVGLAATSLSAPISEYCGLDPSPVAAGRCRQAMRLATPDVVVHEGFAHEVGDVFAGREFDVVLLSSTAQFFPGLDYLREVLFASVGRLAPGGVVVITDLTQPDSNPAAGHLAVHSGWFVEQLRGLGVEVDVLSRAAGTWSGPLARRYDVVITRGDTRLLGSPADGVRTVLWPAVAGAVAKPSRDVAPDDLAYVIFTSGSTGEPKGVGVTHRSAVNLISWVNHRYQVSPRDCLLLVNAFTFDLSVYDILGILAAGGSIRILTDEELLEPETVLHTLDHDGVTFWDSAPAAMGQVMSVAPDPEAVAASLRLVFLSGDWVPLGLPDRIRRRYGPVRVVALGGTTETTVWSSYVDIEQVDPDWPSIPYGSPIWNTGYYVLDSAGRLCRVGEVGDLHIGGVGVSRGYLGDDERTAERFLPDPFYGDGGDRMYRTGDRTRWLPDGQVQFLGRIDDQVKIRGFRVELGDVTAALLRVAGVADAAALTVDSPTGAALAAGVAGLVDEATVLREVAKLLPEHMVPIRALVLPALPTSANGKVDRAAIAAALSQRAAARPTASKGSAAQPVEAVAALVGEVLGVAAPPADVSFINAGGHSLAAVHLRAQLLEVLGKELRVSEILGARSIAALAASGRDVREPVRHEPVEASWYEPSHAQRRALYEMSVAPDVSAYQNQVTLALPGHLSVERVVDALAAVVAGHPVLRSQARQVDGDWRVTIDPPCRPDVPYLDLRGGTVEAARVELRRQLSVHWAQPWQLATGPLISWRLYRISATELVLSQVEHHLIHDGWSLMRLVGSIDRALAGLPIVDAGGRGRGYAEYVALEREYLDSAAGEADTAALVGRLVGAPAEPVALAPDRAAKTGHRGPAAGDWVNVFLTGAEYRTVSDWAGEIGVTPFEVLMAAFFTVLHQYTGEEDMVIGSAVGARPAGFEQTLGMFVNTVALRVRWSDVFVKLVNDVSHCLRVTRDQELVPLDVVFSRLRQVDPVTRPALYDCMFSSLDARLPEPANPEHGPLSMAYHQNETTKVPLDVLVIPKQSNVDPLTPDGGLRLLWEFDRDLYERGTIEAVARDYVRVIRALVAAVSSGTAMDSWLVPPPEAAPLKGPVRPVRQVPEAVPGPRILGSGGGSHEWDSSVASPACDVALERGGIGAGSVVAVDGARDGEYVRRVLALRRRGAVVMPLGRDWPTSRRDGALRQAHAYWPAAVEDVRALPGARQLARRVGTAYVIHTSGTTGEPKVVPVSWRTLDNYIDAFVEELGLVPSDVVLGLNSVLFDAFFEEVWAAAAVGAALVIPAADGTVETILAEIQATGVTVVDMPTALWNVLADHLEESDRSLPATVRAVVIGGEDYDSTRAAAFSRRHAGRVRLISMYGPAECGISVAVHEVGEPSPGQWPELGRAIPNAELWIVDEAGRPVVRGRSGLLAIGGLPGAESSYADAESFRYLTRDRARLTPSGRLLFLGRAEDEFKVRGYRVAAGEVERHARTAPGVSDAAAVGIPAPTSTTRITLFVTGGPNDGLAEGVRRHLQGRLPRYMVPETVTAVDRLPLTTNGKVDRAALAEAAVSASVGSSAGPVEEHGDHTNGVVHELWRQLLPGSGDRSRTFLDAGGDSLAAMRLAGSLAAELGVRLRLRDILDAPGCCALDERVGALR